MSEEALENYMFIRGQCEVQSAIETLACCILTDAKRERFDREHEIERSPVCLPVKRQPVAVRLRILLCHGIFTFTPVHWKEAKETIFVPSAEIFRFYNSETT